ncbi:GM16205, partial [Drosophila sechellia]
HANLAICSHGYSPNYMTTSAAMELIDIREFFQHINNALVDFLLRAAESGMYMGEQMDYNN